MIYNEEKGLEEKQISSEKVYSGRLLQVYKDTVELPSGAESGREYIKHVGAVCIVALTDDGKIVMERQYRYPVGEVVREIPAGKLDSKDEDPVKAAARELKEETGITAEKYEYLGPLYPTCAYSDEVIHMFAARSLSFGDRHTDDDEFLEVELVPLDDVAADIMAGKIADAKTQAAVMRVWVSEHSVKKNKNN